MRKIRLIDVSKLREIIKYQVEGRGGKINPKDDFIGFIEDIKSCLTLPKEELDKEKVEKILESHITHVSLYHDKECGRVTQEQIIFKARFKKTAQAIHDHFTLPKEEEEPSCDFCKEYKRNCVCSLLKEELDKNKMMKVIKENVPRYIRLRKDEMPVGFVYPIPPLNDIRFEDLAKALCQAYSEGRLKKE